MTNLHIFLFSLTLATLTVFALFANIGITSLLEYIGQLIADAFTVININFPANKLY